MKNEIFQRWMDSLFGPPYSDPTPENLAAAYRADIVTDTTKKTPYVTSEELHDALRGGSRRLLNYIYLNDEIREEAYQENDRRNQARAGGIGVTLLVGAL